jgi:hypothetical protein
LPTRRRRQRCHRRRHRHCRRKAACHCRRHAATMLPPLPHCRRAATATAAAALLPSCCRQAATAVAKLPATADLPLRCHCRRRTAAALPKVLPPLPKLGFHQAAASAAKLATAAKLLPPLPSCRRCCLRCRASPRPIKPVPAGSHIDCCVFKGCDRADPSKWAVWLWHGHLVPFQSPGQVLLSYFDWEKRAAFPPKKHGTPSSAQPHVASDAFDF